MRYVPKGGVVSPHLSCNISIPICGARVSPPLFRTRQFAVVTLLYADFVGSLFSHQAAVTSRLFFTYAFLHGIFVQFLESLIDSFLQLFVVILPNILYSMEEREATVVAVRIQ